MAETIVAAMLLTTSAMQPGGKGRDSWRAMTWDWY